MNRNSNIELIRIVAMIMILMLHGIFREIGEPSIIEANESPFKTVGYLFLNMLCLCSVNLYVLISGWFGIQVRKTGLLKFLFQCIFVLSFMYVLGLVLGLTEFSIGGLLECILIGDRAWFVKAYLALYILSPVLNKFCEISSEKQFKLLLIGFFTFQTVFGAFSSSASFINRGFSCFSFVGLYLLARYFKLYGRNLYKYGFSLFILSLIGSVIWYYIPLRFGILRLSYMSSSYVSPLIITEALGILLYFATRKPYTSSIINFFAASSFTVYLCHDCNTWTQKEYTTIATNILENYSGINYALMIGGFIICVYLGATILDQLRKFIWNSLNFKTAYSIR